MTTLLIDLDGTLVDPAPGIIGGFRHALSQLGVHERPDGDLRWIIGPPLRESFARRLAGTERVEDAIAHYRAQYGQTGLFEATAYDGIHDVVATLREQVDRLLLCTSKPRVFAERVVAHFELASLFDALYGAELDGRFDDKGDLIAHIIRQESLTADLSCMIGDRRHDIVAARRHGMCSIGVLWGYGDREELTQAGATMLCEKPADLPRAVSTLFA